MDNVDPKKRSQIMAQVKSSGNKSTEIAFLKILKDKKITGWRRKYKLIGSPDLTFPRSRVVVFLDGCLWHGCYKHCRIPSTNQDYWISKINKNKVRDQKVNKELKEKGWEVIRIWEHEIHPVGIKRKLNKLIKVLNLDKP